MTVRRLFVVAALLSAIPMTAEAQTGQRFSFQISGLYSSPGGEALEGVGAGGGYELQFRWNPSAFSVGLGLQGAVHSIEGVDLEDASLTLAGAFIEPRYIFLVGSDRFAPYGAARFASTAGELEVQGETYSVTGTTVNLGGGVLMRLSGRTNLDLGVTAGSTSFDPDPESGEELGTGSNVIFRLGVAIGIGK